jgi:Na+/H+ antiporter NhaD/arsenite permease-like protein
MVAVSVAVTDWCWTKYMIYVSKHHPLKAANWGTAIMVLGMFTLISYMEDKRLIPAALVGSYLGIYFSVKYSKPKKKDE